MRLRFRIWRKEDHYMITSHVGVAGRLREGLNVPILPGFSDLDITPHPENYIFMQYTGKLDDNKEEICEGDIIEFEYGRFCEPPTDVKTKCKVIYDEENACFSIVPLEPIKEFEGYPLFALDGLRVVGNVYELSNV